MKKIVSIIVFLTVIALTFASSVSVYALDGEDTAELFAAENDVSSEAADDAAYEADEIAASEEVYEEVYEDVNDGDTQTESEEAEEVDLSEYKYIKDYTGSLTDDEAKSYDEELKKLSAEYGFDIVILIVSDTGYKTNEEYGDDYYDNGGYSKDGILTLMRTGEPYYDHLYITSTGKIADKYTDDDANRAFDGFEEYLDRDDISGAVRACIDSETELFDTIKSSMSFKWFRDLLISLVIGFAVALIAVSSMKDKLKSVSQKNEAADYVVPGSFELRDSRDLLLYVNVSKIPIPQNDSRGSGGSGFHVSSSGISHHGTSR